MPFTKRTIIVVSAAVADAANQAALQLDPVGGLETFTVGLSADGSEPITHYWCSVALRDAAWQSVQQMMLAFPPEAVNVFESVEPEDVLTWMGLQRISTGELS